MKITKSQLKQIIKEELESILNERSEERTFPGMPNEKDVEAYAKILAWERSDENRRDQLRLLAKKLLLGLKER
tara:strand:+ start:2439 stop:2657 length:219 start_codon:yes stop_codon:yes gene_type:complete